MSALFHGAALIETQAQYERNKKPAGAGQSLTLTGRHAFVFAYVGFWGPERPLYGSVPHICDSSTNICAQGHAEIRAVRAR